MRRRLFSLFVILFFALPVGVALSGCGKAASTTYCSGTIGPRTGDAQNIALTPTVGGISLGYAQTASVSAPTATDCKSNAVTISKYTYSTVDPNNATGIPVADVNPTTGGLCGGTWNRNTPGGVPDYTFCTGTNRTGIAELTAAGGGATSNKVLVYVHAQITSVALGTASACLRNADGTLQDPATNCLCGNTVTPAGGSSYTLTSPNCYSASTSTTAAPLNSNSCLSFGNSGQVVARFYAGDPSVAANNITLNAGHATFTPQTTGLVTFNSDTGVATALAPGTTIVTASIANSTSTAGLISVCPPKSITISTANSVNGAVTVNPNNTEPITAVVLDTNNVTITGLALTVTSTTPVAIPASAASITPAFPGVAAINAFCLPPSCNPSPYGNVGLLGTGKPVASNTITATTPGSNSTKLWIGSTDSTYIVPVDLTTGAVPSPTRLPYTPNSMIISQNGGTIFMGSPFGLMTFGTSSNGTTSTNTALQGTVLAVSPDSSSVVISDSTRSVITLYNSTANTTTSTYTGIGTRAAFSPDGETLYVTTQANHLLVYSAFTSWQEYDLSGTGANDVTIAIPEVGAFVGGNTAINGRSYCPNSTVSPTIFYPQASSTTVAAAVEDRIAATNDGRHVLDVRLPASGGTPIVNDMTFTTTTVNGTAFTGILPINDCPRDGTPPVFGTAVKTLASLSNTGTTITTPSVTGVFPTTDSTQAFITYLPTSTATTTAQLPLYTTATGTASFVPLASGATAPVFGVLSSDNKTFFTGTSGDNLVHFITRSTLTDTSQLNPKLPSNSTSTTAVPNLIVQYPRTITNN